MNSNGRMIRQRRNCGVPWDLLSRVFRSGLSCGAGCPACRIADGPSARRVKNEAHPCSPRAGFPSSPGRLGSLRHSRQGCLRYDDNPVTENLWMLPLLGVHQGPAV